MSLLAESVLVLNRYFLAIEVCTAKDAICLIYKGIAKVLDEDFNQYTFDKWAEYSEIASSGPFIHSPSKKLLVPSVIYLHDCEVVPDKHRTVKYSRKNIFHRDNLTCQYCAKKLPRSELTLDHIIPKSKGGKNTYKNLVTACKPCNAKKADRTPQEAGMLLIAPPKEPKWKSHVGTPFSKQKNMIWERFLV